MDRDFEMERDEYEAIVMRHSAAFTDILGRYVGRLSKADKEYFVAKVFDIGFDRRSKIGPQIRLWWDENCRLAAALRPSWPTITINGIVQVRGDRLGQGVR